MDKQTPTSTDKNILKEIISISSVMSDHATGIMLCKKIQESKLLPCNKGEIIGILETLAICGILETPEHKGYIHSFTPPLIYLLQIIDLLFSYFRPRWGFRFFRLPLTGSTGFAISSTNGKNQC